MPVLNNGWNREANNGNIKTIEDNRQRKKNCYEFRESGPSAMVKQFSDFDRHEFVEAITKGLRQWGYHGARKGAIQA